MYLPPLFRLLLPHDGRGFLHNMAASACGFSHGVLRLFSKVGDHSRVLLYAGFLFLPAAVLSSRCRTPKTDADFVPRCLAIQITEHNSHDYFQSCEKQPIL